MKEDLQDPWGKVFKKLFSRISGATISLDLDKDNHDLLDAGLYQRGDFKQLLEKAKPKQGETLLLGFPEEKDYLYQLVGLEKVPSLSFRMVGN